MALARDFLAIYGEEKRKRIPEIPDSSPRDLQKSTGDDREGRTKGGRSSTPETPGMKNPRVVRRQKRRRCSGSAPKLRCLSTRREAPGASTRGPRVVLETAVPRLRLRLALQPTAAAQWSPLTTTRGSVLRYRMGLASEPPSDFRRPVGFSQRPPDGAHAIAPDELSRRPQAFRPQTDGERAPGTLGAADSRSSSSCRALCGTSYGREKSPLPALTCNADKALFSVVARDIPTFWAMHLKSCRPRPARSCRSACSRT